MSETIKIIHPTVSSFPLIEGSRTRDLISRLTKLDSDERDNLINETTAILSQCVNPVNTVGSITGIAIGYVQSGKTMSFTTLTALALDNGFRIIIYLTGIKNNLLEQTTKRLKKDLLTQDVNSNLYKVYQNPSIDQNIHIKIKHSLELERKPGVLITVLKRFDSLDKLTRVFQSPEIQESLGNNGVLIIDDEADQASLNTNARKNSESEDWEDTEFSTTYASILNLKSAISNHSYIQYTATPQGPLLINIMDLLSPKFHVVLTPGKAYTGGKTFFIEKKGLITSIPEIEKYHHKKNPLAECPQSLIDALQQFLIGVAIEVNIKRNVNFLSMMVHAASEKDASKKFYTWIKNLLDVWGERFKLSKTDPSKAELIGAFKIHLEDAAMRYNENIDLDKVILQIHQVILDTNIELVIGGSKEIEWSNASSHILIGADMLNRGFTVEGLAVTYMPRYSIGKSNADTIQQRCRFFGYKLSYLNSCRVFLPNDSILEYVDYVEHEEIMRSWLKGNTLKQIEQLLILSPEMNPTRSNILSKDVVKHKLSGWRQMNALQHIESNISYVKQFISNQNFTNCADYKTPARNHRFVKLEIEKVIEFLKDFKIMNVPDALRKSSTIQYMKYLADKKNLRYAYIYEMGYNYHIEDKKGTEILKKDDSLKLSNIFAGPSNSGSTPYPGDRKIREEDSICIQIHHIKIKDNSLSLKWGSKNLYTLGIYYPEAFAHSFVGVEK